MIIIMILIDYDNQRATRNYGETMVDLVIRSSGHPRVFEEGQALMRSVAEQGDQALETCGDGKKRPESPSFLRRKMGGVSVLPGKCGQNSV